MIFGLLQFVANTTLLYLNLFITTTFTGFDFMEITQVMKNSIINLLSHGMKVLCEENLNKLDN